LSHGEAAAGVFLARRSRMAGSRRTILYYPSIVIPDGPWLRQALLYFDDLGSIFPTKLTLTWEDQGEAAELPEHMKILHGEGQYRRFAPEYLLKTVQGGDGWQVVSELGNQLRTLVQSEAFAKRLPANDARHYVRVHAVKVSPTVFGILADAGLASQPMLEDGDQWHRVEETVAHLYLGMLATALAENENEQSLAGLAAAPRGEVTSVVTGTDLHQHESLVWRTREQRDGDAVFESRWLGVLPTPGSEVPIQKIIDFKRKHRDQMLQFRSEVDTLVLDLSKTNDIARTAVAWREKMERELSTLTRLMGESRWQVIWGSMKAMLDIKQLGVISALAALELIAAPVSIPLALAGMAVGASIQIAGQVVEHGRRKRRALDGSAFSYLLSARSDGVFE